MKRYFAGLILLLTYCYVNLPESYGTYTILRDAGNLTRGKLPNERIDCTSVTCLGSNLSIDINISTADLQDQINFISTSESSGDVKDVSVAVDSTTLSIRISTGFEAQTRFNADVNSSTDSLRLAHSTSATKLENLGIAYASTTQKMQDYQAFSSTRDTQSQVFTSFMSTSNDQQDKFVRFNSTSDTHQDTIANFLSTAGVNIQNLNVFRTTTDTLGQTYQSFRSTGDTQSQVFTSFMSTSNAQQDKFVRFNSTSDTHQDATLNFLSTNPWIANNGSSLYSTARNIGIGTTIPDIMDFVNSSSTYLGIFSTISASPAVLELVTISNGDDELPMGVILFGNKQSGAYARIQASREFRADNIGFKFNPSFAGDIGQTTVLFTASGNVNMLNYLVINSTSQPPSSALDIVGGSITVRGNTSGISVSTVSLRAGGKIVFPDATEQTTAPTGGAETNSTDTIRFVSGSIVYQTNTQNVVRTTGEKPIPGTTKFIKESTGATKSFSGYTMTASTTGSTFLRVGESTGGAVAIWSMISPQIEIATNTTGTGSAFSLDYSSRVALGPNKFYAMFVGTHSVSGITAENFGVNMPSWLNKRPE